MVVGGGWWVVGACVGVVVCGDVVVGVGEEEVRRKGGERGEGGEGGSGGGADG